jgi:hypothetical protein
MIRQIRHLLATALTLVMLALPATAQSTRVYKWLDAQGNVHYSDRLPSDATATHREVLNRDGVRIRQLDLPEMTAAAAAERQEVLRSAQRDTALTVSFDDEADLRRTHEERLGLVRNGLAIARGATEKLQIAYAEHESHAASFVAAGKPVPLPVQEHLEQARRMLEEQRAETGKLQHRYDDLLVTQNAELARYRELAGTR